MAKSVDFRQVVQMFFRLLYDGYLEKLAAKARENPDLLDSMAGFLIAPTKVVLYFCKTHIVVEYEGPDRIDKLPENEGMIEIQAFDYASSGSQSFDKIIGFSFRDGTSGFRVPLITCYDDLILPTNRGLDKLLELGWNINAQDHLLAINGGGLELVEGRFARIVNGFFFDASNKGLMTRRIKWADCFPITRIDAGKSWKIGFRTDVFGPMAEADALYRYYVPKGYRRGKLAQVNRFIEFYSAPKRQEPEITRYLSAEDYQFLITMRFGCVRLIPQPKLEWQSEKRDSIQPDFILVQSDDSGEICEFKLPHLKSLGVVGRANRRKFSEEISSYVSQTRVYRDYFDDPNNRRWVEQKYGVKMRRPSRYLIVGSRSDISYDEWRDIEGEYPGLRIYSYNDLVDGVVAQLYR